jgi:hypothetical protein
MSRPAGAPSKLTVSRTESLGPWAWLAEAVAIGLLVALVAGVVAVLA